MSAAAWANTGKKEQSQTDVKVGRRARVQGHLNRMLLLSTSGDVGDNGNVDPAHCPQALDEESVIRDVHVLLVWQ